MAWRWVGMVLAAAVLAVVAACSPSDAGRAPGPVRVVVSIPPLVGLVKPLLPEGATVRAIVPPNRSEHSFELTSGDLEALAKADVIVLVGLGLEPQIEAYLAKHPRATQRYVRFGDAVGIKGDGGSHDHAHDHGHSHGHDHAHGGVDPHLWLDPELCRKLIPALDAAIRAVDPAAPADAAAKLDAQIAELDEWAKKRLEPVAGRALVTHHSAWERFADRYDLIIAAVIRPIETVEETTEGVRAAIETIRKQGLKTIFVEPQFGKDAVKKIVDETGVRVGELDPLGDGDWFAMMRKNVEAVAAGLVD